MRMRFLLLVSLLLTLWIETSYGIFEDQAGELDWSVENVGRVIAVAYGGSDKRAHPSAVRGTARAAYVATDQRSRAIARIDSKTGAIKWRRVLYEGDNINTIQLTNYGLLSVSKEGQNVRLWDVVDGTLLWDIEVKSSSYGEAVAIGEDRVLLVSLESALLVRLKDGIVLWRVNLPSPLLAVTSTLVSLDTTNVVMLGATSSTKSLLFSIKLATGVVTKLPLDAETHAVALLPNAAGDATLITMTAATVTLQSLADSSKTSTLHISDLSIPKTKGTPRFEAINSSLKHSLVVQLASKRRVYFTISSSFQAQLVAVIGSDGKLIESSTDEAALFHVMRGSPDHVQIESLTTSLQWDAHVDVDAHGGDVAMAFASCPTRKKDLNSVRCRVMLVMKDDGLIMTSNEDESDTLKSTVLWIRHEALANVKDIGWITPAETAMEKQVLKSIPSFMEQLKMDMERIQQFFSPLFALLNGVKKAASESTEMITTVTLNPFLPRRYEPANAHFFGFSKYLVMLTQSGRLFAIRGETNEIVWSTFIGVGYRLLVTRDHPALGVGAELLLVSPTGQLIWIDGDTGKEIEANDHTDGTAWVVVLPKRKLHVDEDATLRRAIALVSKVTLEVTIMPVEMRTAPLPEMENFYFYSVESKERLIQGYTIEKKHNGGGYAARQVWSIVVPLDQQLVAFTRQREHAVIDSSVTITGDDSLLLKYLNPHLFGMATVAHEATVVEGKDGVKGSDASILYVSLVDSVSGRLIHRVRHVHGVEPVHMVQSENWFVYSFWNSKDKRTEVVSLSLFDGAVGTHSLNLWKRPTWNEYRSSYDPKAPFVLQKSFIFPTRIATLGCTVTARGITPHYVLVGMETGQIFSLSRSMIDPRQPDKPPTTEEQNEGLIQYNPLIPLYNSLTSMVTYNKTIANLHTISTTSAELESTTLVFAYGLDLFYIRFAPAKAFDVLPLDFNYELLVLLCLGFLGATIVTKTMAQRKALNEAWK